MLEIEAKLKVDSLDEIRRRLQAGSAGFVSRVLEENRVYDRRDGSLRAAGCGLRVRRCRRLAGEPAPDTMTYKGARQPGPYKKRPEISLGVDSADAASELLTALGCIEVMRFEKKREIWRFAGCEVALDEVPHLGAYVEIEGPDTQTIRRGQGELGLEDCAHIPEGYVTLLSEFCKRTGRDPSDISFSHGCRASC